MDWIVIIRNAERRYDSGDPRALRLWNLSGYIALNNLALISCDQRWRI